MSTPSKSTRPASRTGQRFPLRKPGQEATKPKPSAPAKQGPIVPPSYAKQDAETGSVDEDVTEKVEEEEEQEAKASEPQIAKPQASSSSVPSRKKASKFPAIQEQHDTYETAPYLSFLSLLSDVYSQPAKPAKRTEVFIDFKRLMSVNRHTSSLLAFSKELNKEIPTYNSVYSRLALCLLTVYKILAAREKCAMMTYEEGKVMKQLRRAHDFESQIIPSPYLAILSTIGFHIPTDSRYEVICPRLPFQGCDDENIDLSKAYLYTTTDHEYVTFPHFPSLFALATLLTNEAVMSTIQLDDDSIVPRNTHGKNIILMPFTGAFKTNNFVFNRNVKAAADRAQHLGPIAANVAINEPFPGNHDYMNATARSLALDDLPDPNYYRSTAGDAAPADLMTYFGVKRSYGWVSIIMQTMTDEARFFEGPATLQSLGFETGPNIFAILELKLKADPVIHGWYHSIHQNEDGNKVVTRIDNVPDSMLRMSALTATITKYTGGHANNEYNDFASISVSNTVSDRFNAYNGHPVRVMHEAPLLETRFYSHIKSEMFKGIAPTLYN